MDFDILYMHRCLYLAALGVGKVEPNPMVGCVIVHNNRIIGEGYHHCFGGPHAEINALASVKECDKPLLKEATLYVNLEPCSHYGKTPPCANRLAAEGIKRVVIANIDPNPRVAGRGVKILQDAGCEVITGILEKEAWNLNIKFFTYHTKKRPWILLKWAQTSDGFIDGTDKKTLVISNEITKALVHKLRAEIMGILVGRQTALKDNPKLHTTRWEGKNPTRFIIDKNLLVPQSHNIYDGSVNTVIYNNLRDDEVCKKLDFSSGILPQIMDDMYQRGIISLMVEGGQKTLESFIKAGLYDAVQIEISPAICNEGTLSPKIDFPKNFDIKEYKGHKVISF